ncbi:hypothetical protein [Streptomyces sp. NPDC020298]|uniref:hypothetical protein n=1 Tax=unclassified Streptomyces TaxID=2593676 RepID=UPI003401EA27
MSRRKFVRSVFGGVASGLVAGLIVNPVWLAVSGRQPSLLVSLVATYVVTSLWGIGQAIRFHRKWKQVAAAYRLPALGEGIEIPHRPPTDGGEDQ